MMLAVLLGAGLSQAGEIDDLSRPGLYRAGRRVVAASGALILTGTALFIGGVAGPEPDREVPLYMGLTLGVAGVYGLSVGPWLSGLALRSDVPEHPTWAGQYGSTFGVPMLGALQAGMNVQALNELEPDGPRALDEDLDRELERMERREEWLDEELRYLEELEQQGDQGARWLEQPPLLGRPWAIRAVHRARVTAA